MAWFCSAVDSGENFCAGADLKEFGRRSDPAVAEAHCRNGHAMALALVELDKPLIAAIEGACLGGGFEIALCCQMRIIAEGARLGLPEINRGGFPGTGGIPLLERLLGAARAYRWLARGEIYPIGAAETQGIVDEVVPTGAALDVSLRIANELAARPVHSMRAVTKLLHDDFRREFRAYLERERALYVAIYQTQDAAEGWNSFLEKRPPQWRHI
nr:enoyl-CoA hydratase-related protein [Sphingomonas sp. JUb134]